MRNTPLESYTKLFTVTIANGASLSNQATLAEVTAVAIVMPAAWTAANLTFQASHDNATFNNLYDEAGNEYTVTASTSRFIKVDPAVFAGIRYIKIRSGTSAAAVNQGAARDIVIVARGV
jgi:hypothetical protein